MVNYIQSLWAQLWLSSLISYRYIQSIMVAQWTITFTACELSCGHHPLYIISIYSVNYGSTMVNYVDSLWVQLWSSSLISNRYRRIMASQSPITSLVKNLTPRTFPLPNLWNTSNRVARPPPFMNWWNSRNTQNRGAAHECFVTVEYLYVPYLWSRNFVFFDICETFHETSWSKLCGYLGSFSEFPQSFNIQGSYEKMWYKVSSDQNVTF